MSTMPLLPLPADLPPEQIALGRSTHGTSWWTPSNTQDDAHLLLLGSPRAATLPLLHTITAQLSRCTDPVLVIDSTGSDADVFADWPHVTMLNGTDAHTVCGALTALVGRGGHGYLVLTDLATQEAHAAAQGCALVQRQLLQRLARGTFNPGVQLVVRTTRCTPADALMTEDFATRIALGHLSAPQAHEIFGDRAWASTRRTDDTGLIARHAERPTEVRPYRLHPVHTAQTPTERHRITAWARATPPVRSTVY